MTNSWVVRRLPTIIINKKMKNMQKKKVLIWMYGLLQMGIMLLGVLALAVHHWSTSSVVIALCLIGLMSSLHLMVREDDDDNEPFYKVFIGYSIIMAMFAMQTSIYL